MTEFGFIASTVATMVVARVEQTSASSKNPTMPSKEMGWGKARPDGHDVKMCTLVARAR